MGKNNKITKSIIGLVFNDLKIISEPKSFLIAGKKRRMVDCLCICGKQISSLLYSVMSGHTKSCGCVQLIYKEKEKAKKIKISFDAMHNRCYSENYKGRKHYKDKGIIVCKRWHDFKNFYEDVQASWKLGLQLDRYPNITGNYSPDNFRWATIKEQQRNKTSSKLTEKSVIEIRESSLTPNELSSIYKVTAGHIRNIKNNTSWIF